LTIKVIAGKNPDHVGFSRRVDDQACFTMRAGGMVFSRWSRMNPVLGCGHGGCGSVLRAGGIAMLPSPIQLFAQFERGEIELGELHALLALHARELIAEMEEDYQHPAAAWLEGLLARRAVRQLVRRHGGRLLREVLMALAELEDFPPARYLWNASHPDVPLHCFLRMRREPVFRIVQLGQRADAVQVTVEYGDEIQGKLRRANFLLKRDRGWHLRVELPAGGQ
jgi:hypothetical protein